MLPATRDLELHHDDGRIHPKLQEIQCLAWVVNLNWSVRMPITTGADLELHGNDGRVRPKLRNSPCAPGIVNLSCARMLLAARAILELHRDDGRIRPKLHDGANPDYETHSSL